MSGFSFTQCVCVLCERTPALGEVARALDDDGWSIAGQPRAPEGAEGWSVSGPGFVIALRNGSFAVVDLVARPWPDDGAGAGAAWRLGAFGPATFPGALGRALAQVPSGDAEPPPAGAAEHAAFLRLRTGLAAATHPSAPRPDVDPLYDLTSLTDLARPLLRLAEAIGLFTPAGEALRGRAQVERLLARKVGSAPPPIALWTNLRAVELGVEAGARWVALDVVGMAQLGLPDQEALFADGRERPGAVQGLLQGACVRLLAGRSIAHGATVDDAAGRPWRAHHSSGTIPPRRRVVRWLPEASDAPPPEILARLDAEVEQSGAHARSGRGSDPGTG